MACGALGSSANTATPPRSPTKKPTVIATSTTIFRPILASFHHKCLSARMRPCPYCVRHRGDHVGLMYIIACGLNVHSMVAPIVVSHYRIYYRAMLPLRGMALSERD